MTLEQDDILNLVDKLPAFSRSVSRILTLSTQIDASPKELIEVIGQDPVMTARILKLVNSPFFGLSQRINSVHHALVYIGLNTLKNTALSMALVGALPRRNEAGLDMQSFWLHSLAVGSLCRMLARSIGVDKRQIEDYFVAGLLHDLGKIIFAVYRPLEFRQVLEVTARDQIQLCEVERSLLGATHAELGALLARKWQFPPSFEEGIRAHHSPDGERSSLIPDCVFVADQISKRLNYGHAGNAVAEPIPAQIKARLALGTDQIAAAVSVLDKELESARVFIEA